MEGGILLLDKPKGMTSAAVVRAVTGHTGQKCGHLGTLDPMATGLLVVFMGTALRLVPYYLKGRKRYIADVEFGSATDTLDAEGRVVSTAPVPDDLEQRLVQLLPSFIGRQMQTAPAFSAIRVNGERLYDLARQGRAVELPDREIEIEDLRIMEVTATAARLDVTCSSGTYIRSLASDVGKAVGSAAHLSGLRRLASQPFDISEAMSLEVFLGGPKGIPEHLIQPEKRLPLLPARTIDKDQERELLEGRRIPAAGFDETESLLLLSPDGRLFAVGTVEAGLLGIRRLIDR